MERDFYFENFGRGPYYTNTWLIPMTGLVYLQWGRASQDQGAEGER